MSDSELEDWGLVIWQRCREVLREDFRLTSPRSPESALGPERWRAILDISLWKKGDEKSRAILKGQIAQECFKASLPSSGLCAEFIGDFSMEFARQMLLDREKPYWLAMWTRLEKEGKWHSTRFFKASLAIPGIDNVAGPGSFAQILREIIDAAKSGVVLQFDDYVGYLSKRLRRISAPLDATELKIVVQLLDGSATDNKTLAKSLGISPEWASRKISELQKRHILRRFDRVPFSRIGIRMFNFFIDTVDSTENPFRYLKRCPFLYSYQTVLTGRWDALAVMSVPDDITSIRQLDKIEGMFDKWGFESSMQEIASSGAVNCFDHYDPDSGGWEIPWEFMEFHLRRIHGEKLADVIERVDSPANKTRLELDELDMRILDQIGRGNTSIASVRSALNIGQVKASNRIRRLRDEGLIRTIWEAHNIGLNESTVVTTQDRDVGAAIAAWSRRLPRAVVSFDVSRNLTMVTQLPRGGVYGLTRATGYLARTVDVGILDEKIYGGWGFPIELWDEKRQGWKCPKEQLDRWFDEMR
ncbi:MAG: hypothetical protein ACTSV3_05585 [Candidatus Thorarchaeota archaeon]|nr:MAG: hypothetical protein DRP09_06630 [Candidatus Thorarchaeota archaeon]